jgi:hypothetical protein
MAGKFDLAHDYARITLAGIRLFNGVAAEREEQRR